MDMISSLRFLGFLVFFMHQDALAEVTITRVPSGKLKIGDTVTLNCNVENHEAFEVIEWKHGDHNGDMETISSFNKLSDSFGELGRYMAEIDSDQSPLVVATITIQDFQIEDAGVFTCEYQNEKPSVDLTNEVEVEPTGIKLYFHGEEVLENGRTVDLDTGGAFQVSCEISGGYPQPMVHILLNDVNVPDLKEDLQVVALPKGAGFPKTFFDKSTTATLAGTVDVQKGQPQEILCKGMLNDKPGSVLLQKSVTIKFRGVEPENPDLTLVCPETVKGNDTKSSTISVQLEGTSQLITSQVSVIYPVGSMARMNITKLPEEDIIKLMTPLNTSGIITNTIHPGTDDDIYNFHPLTKTGDEMFSMTLDIELRPQRFAPYTFMVRTSDGEVAAACVVKVVVDQVLFGNAPRILLPGFMSLLSFVLVIWLL